jgi:hypothetical protein
MQLEELERDIQALVEGHTEEQLRRRPAPGSWSALECIAHLAETARHYIPAIRAAIEQARAAGRVSSGPFKQGLIARWLIRSMESPSRMRMKSTPFPPGDAPDAQTVLAEFHRWNQELIALIRAAEGIDLGRTKVHSPGSRYFRMSLGNMVPLLAAHGRRHVAQARQALAAQSM